MMLYPNRKDADNSGLYVHPVNAVVFKDPDESYNRLSRVYNEGTSPIVGTCFEVYTNGVYLWIPEAWVIDWTYLPTQEQVKAWRKSRRK